MFTNAPGLDLWIVHGDYVILFDGPSVTVIAPDNSYRDCTMVTGYIIPSVDVAAPSVQR